MTRPARTLWLDFETYYAKDYTLSSLTTEDYITDPRFETILVAIAENDGAPQYLTAAEFEVFARDYPWESSAVGCHNTAFDGRILSYRYNVHPAFLIDTLSIARVWMGGLEAGSSLAKVATHLGLPPKGTEVLNALGKRAADFTPDEFARYGEYSCHDVDLCRTAFNEFMRQGFPENELHIIDMTVRCFTRPILRLDKPLVRQYAENEENAKRAFLTEAVAPTEEEARGIFSSNPKFGALLISEGIEPPMKMSPTTHKETFAFAKSDPGFQELLEHPDDRIRWLAEGRLAVKSTLGITRSKRLLKLADGGKPLAVFLKYCGAHTHRWSGADGTNFQNLDKVKKGKPGSGTLRRALMAPKGWTLVVCDAKQIEARMLAWAAGNTPLLDAFTKGEDVYSVAAAQIYGRPVNPAERPEDDALRQVGKATVLGCGYGMGSLKFAQTILQGVVGPPTVFTEKDIETLGVNYHAFATKKRVEAAMKPPMRLQGQARLIHCAVAWHISNAYRQSNPAVVEFWAKCDRAIAEMMLDEPAQVLAPLPVTLARHAVIMPSGLPIRYAGLQHGESGAYYLQQFTRKHVNFYGGKFTENLIQSLARDVLAEQLVWAKEHIEDCYLVSSTHDEGIFCVPEERGEEMLAKLKGAFRICPAWAKGLPLDASGGFNRRYGDVKK